MYHFKKKILTEDKSVKYTLHKGDAPILYSDFLEGLESIESFRSFFINLLTVIPFRAYQWETPAVESPSLVQPFEFVVSRNPAIDLPPDPGPFTQYFKQDDDIAVFNNLGNDAKLIAPAPAGNHLNYSHIGVFTKHASMDQQHALWKTVGTITKKQIGNQPIWLNTAGGGVAWLHVRLDSRPKYYRHQPYTQ